MRNTSILITLFLFASFAFASTYDEALSQRYNLEREDRDGNEWFAMIQELAGQVQTIDELLPLLPEELKNQHVLMFHSLSLQEADYQNPRVILYSPKAQFVMTFNGDPSQRGFEALETMRFTRQGGRGRFIFEEIVFEGDLRARRNYLQTQNETGEIAFLEDRSDRTGPNPTTCLTCHRSHPRPNWEPYSFWPGAYGQFDDRPFKISQSADERHPHSGRMVKASDENAEAAVELPLFLERHGQLSRYKHLIGLSRHAELENPGYRIEPSSRRTETKFLSTFTFYISQLNFERIVGMIMNSPEPLHNGLRMLRAIRGCYPPYPYQNDQIRMSMLEAAFSPTNLPWEDFYMNLYPAPHNSMRTPLSHARELMGRLREAMPWLGTFMMESDVQAPSTVPMAQLRYSLSCEDLGVEVLQ